MDTLLPRADVTGAVQRRQRMGAMLNYYYRVSRCLESAWLTKFLDSTVAGRGDLRGNPEWPSS
jgi:hypothetical protein